MKDNNGMLHEVDFDLELCKEELDKKGLSATPGGLVYKPK